MHSPFGKNKEKGSDSAVQEVWNDSGNVKKTSVLKKSMSKRKIESEKMGSQVKKFAMTSNNFYMKAKFG